MGLATLTSLGAIRPANPRLVRRGRWNRQHLPARTPHQLPPTLVHVPVMAMAEQNQVEHLGPAAVIPECADARASSKCREPTSAMAVNEPSLGSSSDGKGEKGIDRSLERAGTPLHLSE
jgi:hypothetical protein